MICQEKTEDSPLVCVLFLCVVQEIKPKKGSAQRNVLASVLRLQKKIVKTINESMDKLASQRKSIWWSRWIPREE